MSATTHETVVGIFPNHDQAQHAVQDLYDAGFRAEQVGMMAKDAVTATSDAAINERRDEAGAAGGATGAALGALGGAAVGAGIVMGAIPVVGPILAIGTLGTVLLNAAGGAAAAGLTGALIGWGLPQEDADFYESEVKNGKYLVTVEASGRLREAQSILQRNHGVARNRWKSSVV